MFKGLSFKQAWRIVKIAKRDGYNGPFVVLREPMIEELQLVYGRVLDENKRYAEALDQVLDGKPLCPFCEDDLDCPNHDKWLEGRCKDFMLRSAKDEEAVEAFDECYRECAKRCGGQCSEECSGKE